MKLTPNQVALIVKLFIGLLPLIIRFVREGKIKSAAQDELLIALYGHLYERIDAAHRAREGVLEDEATDPNNRNNAGA